MKSALALICFVLFALGYGSGAKADTPNLLINPHFDSSLDPWVLYTPSGHSTSIGWGPDENNDPNSGGVDALLVGEDQVNVPVVTQCMQLRANSIYLVGADAFINFPTSDSTVGVAIGYSFGPDCNHVPSLIYSPKVTSQNAWTPVTTFITTTQFQPGSTITFKIALAVVQPKLDVAYVFFDNAYMIEDGVFRSTFDPL